ncbi:MAG: protein jag [Clostridia bacterium]|nr:protein jag [Clostridia bacterium]MBQ8399703.1 protein jag [Clostridia bacterium]
MKQELIVTGATIEEALQNGALEIGVKPEELEYEVLVEPKKGILGIGKVAAKLKVSYTADPAELAMDFIRTLLANMEADAQVEMEKGEGNERLIKISGKDAGSLIGYHGETLDALQYLANLAANKKSDETDERNYTRILLDIENYREKRAETLKALARRMAHRVLKYKRNVTLEPMSSYERRIIHSEIQGIEGVTTYSVGADNNRKVVIQLED